MKMPKVTVTVKRNSKKEIIESLILEPSELVKPKNISKNELKVINDSIINFEKGKVSEPVDLSDF